MRQQAGTEAGLLAAQEALVAPDPGFVDLRVADIIPQRLRSAYDDACGNA